MASTKIKSLSLNGVTWIQSGYGTPDHISVKGTLYIDLETAIEYINKDGLSLWGEYYDSTYIDSILTGVSGSNSYITGGTYSSGTTIMTNNSGGTFNITGYTYIPHLQYNNLNSTVWNYGSGNLSDNISFGRNALVSITNGNNNSAIGSNALSGTTTGNYNAAIGGNALKNNNTGVQNFGIGSYALYYNTTGSYNTAIGTSALQNNTDAERNVAIGGFSLYRNIGSRNIAIGFFAGSATKGSDNILLGANAVNTTDGVVSGSNNTIIGTLLSGVINGSNNTIFGKPSGLASTTTNNIIIADGSGNIRFKDDNVNTILPRLAGTGDRMVVTSPNGELSARTIVDTLFTGGTVVGETNFTTNLSANTISATTYLNLPIYVSGVIFVSDTIGNDSTAIKESTVYPYKTFSAALSAYWADSKINKIEILDSSTYTHSGAMNDGTTSARRLKVTGENAFTLNITTVNSYTYNSSTKQYYIFDTPYATLNLAPLTSTGNTGFNAGYVNINCNIISFTSNWNGITMNGSGNSAPFKIICNTLNINGCTSGIAGMSGGNRQIDITAKTINFVGAGTKLMGAFCVMNLDFDSVTHNNTFTLSAGVYSISNINHGSITGVSPYVNTTAVNYMNSSYLNVKYKVGAVISSNVYINCFNSGGVTITGVVNYPNSDFLLYGVNVNTVNLVAANITCKKLFSYRCTGTLNINNSYVKVTGPNIGDYSVSGADDFYTVPTLLLSGVNSLIGPTSGFTIFQRETFWTAVGNPTLDFSNTLLHTNGVISRTYFNLIENTSGIFGIIKIDNTILTLPSVTNTLIESDITGKAVITKEYINNRLVLEKSTDYTLLDSDSGRIIIFTASAILTIPTGLAAGFECTFVTLTGATLTVTSTGNTLNNAVGTTLSPNLSFTLKRMITTNTFIATGNL